MTKDPSSTALIRALEAQRYTAMQVGNLDVFEGLCHPALVYVHSNGIEDNLERYLEKCRQGLYVYHRIDHAVNEVWISQDTALVFGEMSADITSHGVAKSIHNRTLSVWLNTDLGWQMVAYQPTPILKPIAPALATGD
jgi:ketosteroid isomerase-like protein